MSRTRSPSYGDSIAVCIRTHASSRTESRAIFRVLSFGSTRNSENSWSWARRRAPFSAQDCINPLAWLKRTDGYVEFAGENQGNWCARCMAGEDDPVVYTNAGEGGGGSDEFTVVASSVSAFLITLCLQEAVLSSPVCFHVDAPREGALAVE